MKTLVALLLALSLPAWAAPSNWQAKPGTGHISFTAYWNGTPVKGHFPDFTLDARLDPEHPAGGHITLKINVANLTTQSADIANAIRGQAWFDVKHFPHATFASSSIDPQPGSKKLTLTGKLRIKGHEEILSFPIKLESSGGLLELRGTVQLDRTDFAIGSGQWSGGSVIAHKVDVSFSFVLIPAN